MNYEEKIAAADKLVEGKDYVQAKELLIEIYQGGYLEYSYEIAEVERLLGNTDSALYWFQTAAENEVCEAYLMLGEMHEDLGDVNKALTCYSKAAACGFSEGFSSMAVLYRFDERVKNLAKAEIAYFEAGLLGDLDSVEWLLDCYESGELSLPSVNLSKLANVLIDLENSRSKRCLLRIYKIDRSAVSDDVARSISSGIFSEFLGLFRRKK
jgi:TPR repeat protein